MSIYNVKVNIMYSYPKMNYFDEYFDVSSQLLNTATKDMLKDILENDKKAVARCVNEMYKKIKGERDVVDGVTGNSSILPQKAIDLLKGMEVTKTYDAVYVNIPLSGIFTIVRKASRGSIAEMRNIILDTRVKTTFKLKGCMQLYGNEKFSIGFADWDNNYGIALIYEPSRQGKKDSMSLLASYFDGEAYYIDDAKKYIDVTPFIS